LDEHDECDANVAASSSVLLLLLPVRCTNRSPGHCNLTIGLYYYFSWTHRKIENLEAKREVSWTAGLHSFARITRNTVYTGLFLSRPITRISRWEQKFFALSSVPTIASQSGSWVKPAGPHVADSREHQNETGPTVVLCTEEDLWRNFHCSGYSGSRLLDLATEKDISCQGSLFSNGFFLYLCFC
jgi:hypothetical protein